MGEGTESAAAGVIAARAVLADEIDRLEASARAAVDIKAKVKRNPVRAAAVAGGAAFLVVGGPKRVFRRARRAVTGREGAPLPKSLLPSDIEKSLKKMGSDGDKVRGTIERDFAKYLDQRANERRKEGVQAAFLGIMAAALRPVGFEVGRRVAHRLVNPDATSFEEQMQKIRDRRSAVDAAADDLVSGSGGPGSGVGL